MVMYMDSNLVIEREKPYIDDICNRYGYDSNIRHLLYIIIPAFIIKYGIKKEQLVLNTFKNIKIIISEKKDQYIKAYYSSRPIFEQNKYKTVKVMVIQNYEKISLINLLDNLVHEFNHAINSEVIRTGLTYRLYKKNPLSFIRKDTSYILEEIINTKQTEEIIDIIKSFKPANSEISNTIYAINNETNHKYNSQSYYLESYSCKKILENKTFINTLANLRLNGEVYEIAKWFDDIVGREGTYKELILLLKEINELELEYANRKIFKSIIFNKIKSTSNKIMRIVEKFDRSVNYR